MVEYTSVRENSTSIFKNPKEFMETWKSVSLRPTMKEKGGIYILLILITWELRYPRKRGGNRKRVRWNSELRHLCTLLLGVQESSAFLLSYGDKKE